MALGVPLLNVFSGFSLLRSSFNFERGLPWLADHGYDQVGLADYESMAQAENFDRAARAAGMNPWIGITRPVATPSGTVTVRLYALDASGFGRLTRVAAAEPVPALAALADSSLLVAIPPAKTAWWADPALAGVWDRFGQVVREIAPGDRLGSDEAEQGWRWLPSHAVRYDTPGDRGAYEVLLKIGDMPAEPYAGPLQTRDKWLAPYDRAEHGTLWRTEPPPPVLPPRSLKLPDVGPEPEQRLRRMVQDGLRRRYPGPGRDKAAERMAHELQVIESLGFSGYFLVVADLVGYARKAGIRVGPGRGSAAGSLVAYALGITAIDPLRYGLVFERFLNPARKTMPDIDLDFEDDRRHELIEYLRRRWRPERVAQIGTYGTLGARAVLRDVGRVLGQPLERINRVIARVPFGLGDKLRDRSAEVMAAIAAEGGPREWGHLAQALEGLPRHRSTHAAGVVIAPEPLAAWVPCDHDGQGHLVTQMEMGSIERLGFLKLDLLGLKTLGVVRRIEAHAPDAPRDPAGIDPNDPATVRLLGRGDTDGVFQLDGRGVKDLLRKMKPQGVEDVMTVVALYRPGPMDAIQTYLARRRDPKTVPDDPVSTLLGDTFGVLVYQEQLMDVVKTLAGYTLAEADLFRRAVSKKDHALMADEKARFLGRLKDQGVFPAEAERIWAAIASFADYGFNKAHAAAYGLLSFYLAYLKAHWPLAFWCGELSGVSTTDRLAEEMRQAAGQGFVFLTPHVNAGGVEFLPEGDKIRAGLAIIKGIGHDAAGQIVAERETHGPYRDLADFARRIGSRLPLRAMEALYGAGALKGLAGETAKTVSQLSWWDEPERTASDEPGDDLLKDRQAFGFDWPRAHGPLFVRLATEKDEGTVAGFLAALSRERPGPVDVVLAWDRGRGRVLPGVRVAGDWRTIAAIKDRDGVLGAGRQVVPRARRREEEHHAGRP